MLINLLNFADAASGTQDAQKPAGFDWITIVIIGVTIVAFVLMLVIPNRKQKKQAQEMMSKLAVGSIVTTIGGIVGTVVKLDEKNIWLATGNDENQCVMQFVRQAIHSVSPAPDSAEGRAELSAEKKEANEEDEIK